MVNAIQKSNSYVFRWNCSRAPAAVTTLAIILTTLTYNPEGVRSKGIRLYTLPRASILLVQKTEARLGILCLEILLLKNMNETQIKIT